MNAEVLVQKIEATTSPVRGVFYESTLKKARSLDRSQVQAFLSQWYAFSSFIPELLSLYAAKAENELERTNIVENLYSELGLDNGRVSHPQMLFDLIQQATGLPPDRCHSSQATGEFIENLRSSVNTQSPAYNAGLFRGLEHVAYDILDVLKEILVKSGNPHLVGHPYITIHEKIEAQHIDKTEENIAMHGRRREEVDAGFNYVMNQWETFWKSAYLQLIGLQKNA